MHLWVRTEEWETSDGGFRSLEGLHIGCTNLANWKASSNCEELREVPIGLAGILSFQILDLNRSTNAAASALKVGEAKREQGKRSSRANTFEISIFPPPQSE